MRSVIKPAAAAVLSVPEFLTVFLASLLPFWHVPLEVRSAKRASTEDGSGPGRLLRSM